MHRGQVIGRCEDSTGIAPFARLVAQVMTAEPYASADRVFWIVDNGSPPPRPGLNRADEQGMAERTPGPPTRACLLAGPGGDLLLRRAAQSVTPNDFLDPEQIRARLAAFEARYNAVATPFNWKFTRRDLDDLLRRIDAHENRPEDRQLAA